MHQVAISVGGNSLSYTENGKKADVALRSDESVFKRIEKIIRKDAPSFFIVSPDINRQFVDDSIPEIYFVQPALEFTFSPEQSNGKISYAQGRVMEQQGTDMLQASMEKPLPAHENYTAQPMTFSEMAVGWTSDEDDESFLKRLDNIVRTLQDYPDGKMTPTRSYEYRLNAKHNPFKLYEMHARMNGEYACSHFFCIRKGVYSLGTTPENVLEIDDKILTVDVVAATCKPSNDDEYLAQELYKNPKQIKEHKSSLVNRQNRFRPFCKDGSIHLVKDMQIKTLRNVCHLHSVFSGELLPQVTIFDLMGNLFPLIGARPKELLQVADSEKLPHRYYGGVIGHHHLKSGGCFLNIRNALFKDEVIHAKVGTGVIKESTAHSELLETKNKLSGLLEAVYLWEQTFSLKGGAD